MKKYDVVHAEKYTAGGEEKTRWVRCGAVLQTRKGGHVLKLDVVPVNSDGWFQLFEPEKPEKPARNEAPASEDFDDPIPF